MTVNFKNHVADCFYLMMSCYACWIFSNVPRASGSVAITASRKIDDDAGYQFAVHAAAISSPGKSGKKKRAKVSSAALTTSKASKKGPKLKSSWKDAMKKVMLKSKGMDRWGPPSIRPSDQPTNVPSHQPSSLPSISSLPSQAPSNQPSVSQVPSLSVQPSSSPEVSSMTQNLGSTTTSRSTCDLELRIECVLANGEESLVVPCDDIQPQQNADDRVQCTSTQARIEMLFLGRDCGQSNNDQSEMFTCSDETGGIPEYLMNGNEDVYIVVADSTMIYFSGVVSKGDTLSLTRLNRGIHSDTILRGQIFSNGSTDQRLLQEFQFSASCNEDTNKLFLNDVFGSLQVVSFADGQDREVSSLVDVNINVFMPNYGVDALTISTLELNTDIPGLDSEAIDLSPQTNGIAFDPGQEFFFTLTGGKLPSTIQMDYNVDVHFEATTGESETCEASPSAEFSSGPSSDP